MHMYQLDKFLETKLLGERYLYISKVSRNDELTSAFLLLLGAVGHTKVEDSAFCPGVHSVVGC